MLEGKSLIKLVLSIERSFPIHTLNHQGINWWPVLRTFAAMRLRAAPPKAYLEVKKGASAKSQTNQEKIQLSALAQKFAPKFLKSWHNQIAWRQLRKAEGQQKLPKEVDFITFGQPSQKNETLEGVKINRFVEPIHLLSEKKGLHVEAALSPEKITTRQHSPTYFFGASILKHRTTISKNKPQPLPEPFHDWIDQMKTQFSDDFFSLENIQYWIDLVMATKAAMSDLLKECSTKQVILAAFYDPLNFGVSWACSEKSIKVVEIQHGVQNDFHFGYAHWSNLSEQARPFLPTEFWNYSEHDAQRISTQFPDGWVDAKVVGNVWLQWYQRSSKDKVKRDNYGLITLGMDHQFIPEFLIAFLENHDEIRWTLRLHPRAKMQAEDVSKMFKTRGVESCKIVNASEENLFAQIQRSAIHVTGMSSVAIEAAQMGVKTILFMDAGIEYYQDYINKGLMLDGVGLEKLERSLALVKEESKENQSKDIAFTTIDDLII